MISYEDFDLRLYAGSGGLVVSARRGESQATRERFELDAAASWDLAELAKGGREVVRQRGEALFDALICRSIRDLYRQARGGAGDRGLRMRIHFDPRDQQVRPLLRLPWELLFDSSAGRDGLLALDPERPVVRVIDSNELAREPAPGRLERIVLALSSTRCNKIKQALAQAHVWPTVLERITRAQLSDAISECEPQVVHIAARIDGASPEGALLLTGDYGLDDPLTASTLATAFAGKPTPRLVILSACCAAHGGRYGASALSEMAVALTAAGLPAVITIPTEILGRGAMPFITSLYSYLGVNPIEAVMAKARNGIPESRPATLAWAAPLLFTRVTDRTAEETKTTGPGPVEVNIHLPAEKPDWRVAIDRAAQEGNYDEVLRIAETLAMETVGPTERGSLEELLLNTLESASETAVADALIAVLHRVHRSIQAAGVSDDVTWSRRTARMLMEQARRAEARGAQEAVSAYDEIYSRFRDYPDLLVQQQVTRALNIRLDLGWRVLRDPDVDAVANLIIARQARSLTSADDMTRAMLVKAEIRLRASDFPEALRLLDGVIASGSCAEILPRARLRRAEALVGTGLQHTDEALAQIDEVIAASSSSDPRNSETTIEAHTMQAWLLADAERGDEAIETLERARRLLAVLYGEANPLTLRAGLEKARVAESLGRIDAAVSEYETVHRSAMTARALDTYAAQARMGLRRLRGSRNQSEGAPHVR